MFLIWRHGDREIWRWSKFRTNAPQAVRLQYFFWQFLAGFFAFETINAKEHSHLCIKKKLVALQSINVTTPSLRGLGTKSPRPTLTRLHSPLYINPQDHPPPFVTVCIPATKGMEWNARCCWDERPARCSGCCVFRLPARRPLQRSLPSRRLPRRRLYVCLFFFVEFIVACTPLSPTLIL